MNDVQNRRILALLNMLYYALGKPNNLRYMSQIFYSGFVGNE